jgi:hypothetical protein
MGLGLGNSLSSPVYPQTAYAVTRSVSLDGTNDHIVITDSVANEVKNIGSMSIWFKLEVANQNDTIMNIHAGTSNDNKIAILLINQGGSEVIRFNSRGGSSNTILDHTYSASDSVDNGWTHFAATWDRTANKMAIYLNGSSVATSTSSIASFATTADTIYLGKPGNADNAFFQGHFSSFALFDAVLSASNVTTIYNDGSPNIDLTTAGISSLKVFLPLDESSGNFIDRTSTGADGVPTNSPTQGVEDVP